MTLFTETSIAHAALLVRAHHEPVTFSRNRRGFQPPPGARLAPARRPLSSAVMRVARRRSNRGLKRFHGQTGRNVAEWSRTEQHK